jgi:hypothetical protein
VTELLYNANVSITQAVRSGLSLQVSGLSEVHEQQNLARVKTHFKKRKLNSNRGIAVGNA